MPQAIPGPGYLIAIHHAVWRAPNGHLFDVTPFHPDPRHHPIAVRGGTLFLLDDLARPVTSGRTQRPAPDEILCPQRRCTAWSAMCSDCEKKNKTTAAIYMQPARHRVS